jgi:anti-sigma B factor antagonist
MILHKSDLSAATQQGATPMDIMDIRPVDQATVIEPLRNRIDAALAVRFREDLMALIAQGNQRLVIDLSRVDFIDSSGLGVLVSLMKAVGGSANLAICNMKDSVYSVFRLTRMDKIFTIVPTEADALAKLAP